MKLYEIDNAINNCIDMETGEIIDFETLESLQIARDEKLESVALFIKNERAMAETIKAEKLALQERQKTHERRAESLMKYLANSLNGEKFETGKVSVSFRKSEMVEFNDIGLIPTEYLKFKEPEVDKAAIKKALKSGTAVCGAWIEVHSNIQVK